MWLDQWRRLRTRRARGEGRGADRGSGVDDRPVDASMLCVPIERPDGTTVTDLRALRRWKDAKRDAAERRHPELEPVTVRELEDEVHHRSYPGAWIRGRGEFERLLEIGLRRDERVLDLGCGAGRLGTWLIGYLQPERYFGIDVHLRGLVAFSAYELRLSGLAARRPRLLLDGDFGLGAFGVTFDLALDIWCTRPLPDEQLDLAYRRLSEAMASGGRVLTGGHSPGQLERMCVHGFERVSVIPGAGSPLSPRPDGRPARPWNLLRRS